MAYQPLADKIRPKSFDDIVGQSHLFGKNGAIRKMIERNYLTNMIFWGVPGTGKTTAANIIAENSELTLHKLNATSASLADIKGVISDTASLFGNGGVLLYLDEIQYFNKKQQQSLLEFIEDGRIILIASTTENPYMYVYNAIISRSAVFEFKAVNKSDIAAALKRAMDILNAESGMKRFADEEALDYIASSGAGDVRRSVNLLENVYYAADDIITIDLIKNFTSKTIGNFDASGTVHYDLLSALQKSIRGSDPDAAIFYLAKILEGGDLIGACRRLQVIASEDIGLAYPTAPLIIRSCVESARELGMPEAIMPLSHAALLLATAPKSNSAVSAYTNAAADIGKGKGQSIPSYLRPSERYDGYNYPHNYPNHYVNQQYLPDDLKDSVYYIYGDNKNETAAKNYWKNIKGEENNE